MSSSTSPRPSSEGADRPSDDARKPYAAPTLARYGAVERLTLGGSGTSAESAGTTSMRPRP